VSGFEQEVMSTSTSGSGRCSSVEELIERSSGSLRRALVVRFGVDVGVEAHAEVIAYMWEHADRLLAMSNPAGYLFRVGQSAARRLRRWNRSFQLDADLIEPSVGFTPELRPALQRLRPRHRVAVVLVHGYGFSYAEVASILDVPESSIRNDVHRGLTSLRAQLDREDPT
jgi:DNA-directed RNA polymerase specialized sigma24 family protein